MNEGFDIREARVSLLQGMTFDGVSPNGYHIPLDAAPESGGQELGTRPADLTLIAVGGCVGMDVISILRKKRQEVTGYDIVVRGERRLEHPRVFTFIQVEHVLRGRDISPDAVARAIQLSEEKYCPMNAMLRSSVKIKNTFRIVEE